MKARASTGKILVLLGDPGFNRKAVAKELLDLLPHSEMVITNTTADSSPNNLKGEYAKVPQATFHQLEGKKLVLFSRWEGGNLFGCSTPSISRILERESVGILLIPQDSENNFRLVELQNYLAHLDGFNLSDSLLVIFIGQEETVTFQSYQQRSLVPIRLILGKDTPKEAALQVAEILKVFA